MNASDWFIRTATETLGPYSIEIASGLIQRRRIGLTDFAWCSALTKWTRIYEIPEFQKFLPPEPHIPLPGKPVGSPTGGEDRAFLRRAPRVPFKGHFITPSAGDFTIVNISQSGMLMRSEKLPPIGSEIEGRIESTNFNIPALGVKIKIMRHTVTPLFHGAGVIFTLYPENHKPALFEFIAAHASDQLAYE